MSDGLLEYVEEHPSEDGGGRLGRNVVWHDPENRAFPARGAVFAEDAPIVAREWDRTFAFDQGASSACTMFAAAGVMHSQPWRASLASAGLLAYDSDAERISGYRRAQAFDPWAGGEPEYEGSSTDAPFTMLRDEGRIGEWRWCFGLDDVLRTLSNHGPVAVGSFWYSGMDIVDPKTCRVKVSGSIRGGHAYELYAVNPARQEVEACNSWGKWGPCWGRFRLSFDDLEFLLGEDGEACTIVLP